jgi:hypothetical protein
MGRVSRAAATPTTMLDFRVVNIAHFPDQATDSMTWQARPARRRHSGSRYGRRYGTKSQTASATGLASASAGMPSEKAATADPSAGSQRRPRALTTARSNRTAHDDPPSEICARRASRGGSVRRGRGLSVLFHESGHRRVVRFPNWIDVQSGRPPLAGWCVDTRGYRISFDVGALLLLESGKAIGAEGRD